MGELLIQRFNWIPDCLAHAFIESVADSYFDTYPDEMPCATHITGDISDPIILQAASFYTTEGKDIDFHGNKIADLAEELQSNAFYGFIDEYFDTAFDDVLRLMTNLNLSYCFHDDDQYIRQGLRHFGVEVW